MKFVGSKFIKLCLPISILVVTVYSECPLGWMHYDDKCFLFSLDQMDWFTAESSCHFHNGKLAEPADKNQTDYLLLMGNIITKGGRYWLGGRDDIIEGTWQWSSSDKIIQYTPWWPRQPDNAKGDEDCLEEVCDSLKCLYNDAVCSIKRPFICERSYPGIETEIIG